MFGRRQFRRCTRSGWNSSIDCAVRAPKIRALNALNQPVGLDAVPRPVSSAECVAGPGDEASAEDHFQELAPPTWREAERSIECRTTRTSVDECDLNLFAVLDAERQRNVQGELHVSLADGLAASRQIASQLFGRHDATSRG